MRVAEALQFIEGEVSFGRTPWGRRLNDLAISTLQSCIEDEKNHNTEAVQCLNCGIIISSFLAPDGCPNCNGKDLTLDIKEI